MSFLAIVAILLSLSGLFAWMNERFMHLPATIGLMVLALVNALGLLLLQSVAPAWTVPAEEMMRSIDFDRTLMQGMLGYLLFAGALHVDLAKLRSQRTTVFLLATAGVILTTILVGLAAWGATSLLGLHVPLIYCFIFGALIAPTDPIAVLAILKQVGAPKDIELKIVGESLFNDGVGIVAFIGLIRIAGHGGPSATSVSSERDLLSGVVNYSQDLGMLFAIEVGGGLVLGMALGAFLMKLVKSIDDYKTEVLLTLAGVTGGYGLCNWLHLSGPLAMVVAGLFIGNRGRSSAISELTMRRVDEFWELVDEILNAVLFVLIGLEVLIITLRPSYLWAGFVMIPLTVLGRFLAVGGILAVIRRRKTVLPGTVRVLAWGGLRGGVSIALALSLKGKLGADVADVGDLIVTMTYVVVCFSIIGQGLTIGPLLRRLGLAQPTAQ